MYNKATAVRAVTTAAGTRQSDTMKVGITTVSAVEVTTAIAV